VLRISLTADVAEESVGTTGEGDRRRPRAAGLVAGTLAAKNQSAHRKARHGWRETVERERSATERCGVKDRDDVKVFATSNIICKD
jgi:hypothetical protein